MKQFLLMLVMATVGATMTLAQSVKNQTLLTAPSGVYISSYQEQDEEAFSLNPAYPYEPNYPIYPDGNRLNWQDGQGGSLATRFWDDGTPALVSVTWPATRWPQALPVATVSETLYSPTNVSQVLNVDNHYGTTAPNLVEEHCNYSYVNPTFISQCTLYERTADTKVRLATGGSANSSQMNLWIINVSATNYFLPWTNYTFSSAKINPQNISIRAWQPDTNGNIYVVLPDNTNLDVTPVITGISADNYVFNVTAQKYTMTLTANSTNLSTSILGGQPEFCVGQQVTMAVNWQPALPGVVAVNYNWVFQPDYVNQIVNQGTNQSLLETINVGLETNNPTSLWWYGGGVKLAGCNLTLSTTNGQPIRTIYPNGFVSIYRPTITFTDSPPSWVTNVVVDGTFSLSLGNGNIGGMNYEVNVFSKYSGKADFTQLIDRSAANGNTSDSTSGQYWMDNHRFYSSQFDGTNGGFQINSNQARPLFFTDGPHFELAHSAFSSITSIYDQFEDYVIFRPDAGNPNNNIYVTLGVVSGGIPSWSWSASTTYSSGTWSTPSSSITRPTNPDTSDNFPTWLQTYINN
jgi:hypothetical protein